jgi:predicted amidohydrolase
MDLNRFLSICFDLRFPNLYRKLSKTGSIFLSIPSAFTETTGKRHWHSLLKARAIENFSYVFAPAQGGSHYNGRKTFGHSMIVSPDGKILKELKKSEGVITALIDQKLPSKLRSIIPSLKLFSFSAALFPSSISQSFKLISFNLIIRSFIKF